MDAADSELRLLDEAQNSSFDADYHSPEELVRKIEELRTVYGPEGPADILDLGGGNGRFVDALLHAFPNSRATVVDVSPHLLSLNEASDRKELVEASVDDLVPRLGDRKFDLITANWLLHHLVGANHASCEKNVRDLLKGSERFLKPGGTVVVAENMFNGFFGSNLPSVIIWMVTSISFRPWVRLAAKAFNTAGVGVCFQSERSWRRIFGQSGLEIVRETGTDRSLYSGKKRLMLPLLAISSVRHRHFYLKPTGSQSAGD